MHVLFVEPAFPRSQTEHLRALAQVGARVTAIGESPREMLGEYGRYLHGYVQVPSVTHEPSLYEAVRSVQDREWVDRLEATVEAHMMPVAHVRERCEIPGLSAKTTYLCRDKPAMKEALREAGVPCAQSTGARSAQEVRDFAAEVGYPIIVKPNDAAGAAGTFRCENDDELENAIRESGVEHGHSAAVEEFVEGHEGFYDTLCVDGQVVHDFACHYYPNVLEAMRTRWISPQIACTNRIDLADYDEVKDMGKKVIEVLGITTSATHMEWFSGEKGLKFSEIGCRPPGVGVPTLYGQANDEDYYVEWAKLIVHGGTDVKLSRKYSAGMIAVRPDQDGQIVGYEGAEEVKNALREEILTMHLPQPGTGTQDVSAGYHANAWITLRHPDYDELRRRMDWIGETLKVRAR